MRQIPLITIMLSIASSSLASTITTTDSFTGSALIYDPATDYSPATGYSPPGNLGGYDGLLTLQGFDTALGTLNSISLTESVETSLQFQQAVAYGTSIEINAHPYITGQTPYGSAGFAIPYTFFIANTVPFYTTVPYQTYDTGVQNKSGGPSTYTNNLAATFGPFLNQDIYVPVLGYVVWDTGSTGSYLGDATSPYTYSLTITYDYTPAPTASVPEPGALGLVAVGLGMVGLIRRRRAARRGGQIVP